MDAEQLKEMLGNRAKDIISTGLNLHLNKHDKALCPLHKDKNPSMSWDSKALQFHCFGCNENIDIFRYYTEFERMSFVQAKEKVAEMVGAKAFNKINAANKKNYVLPNIQVKELSPEAINYMAKRKIDKQTLDDWRVKQRNWSGKECYVFQYFEDEAQRQPVYVSYREIVKGGLKGGCEPNTKAILWGMCHIDKDKPLVITEGQPDAMVIWQSGYRNVVSVPNGANGFTWIDNCWEWLQDIKEIIVFADNDDPGIKFANEVRSKLKNVKITYHEKYKDANEVLYYEGPEKVIEIIDKAINQMPNGLIDVSQLHYKSIFESQSEGIETGFIEYDRHVEDWKLGELTVIFGRNGEGKTTFTSQIIAHSMEKGVKTFLYSGEMSNDKIQNWLYRQLIGNKPEYYDSAKTKYKTKSDIKPEIIKLIKEWHKETLYLYDRSATEASKSLDAFFDIMKLGAQRYSVKLFVIDNLMAILEENADSLYSDQANFIQRCKDFAVDNQCHVVLLTHPNKEKSEVTNGKPNLEKTDISGSNNIANKADNIIAVERNWGENPEYDAIITSLKDRDSGQRKVMKFNFSKKTLRFYNNATNEEVLYSWEKLISSQLKQQYKQDSSPVGFTQLIDPIDTPF